MLNSSISCGYQTYHKLVYFSVFTVADLNKRQALTQPKTTFPIFAADLTAAESKNCNKTHFPATGFQSNLFQSSL